MKKPSDLGEKPTAFWRNKPDISDASALIGEMRNLPPMEDLSAFFLVRIAYTISLYRTGQKKEPASLIVFLWRSYQRRWFACMQKRLPESNAQDLSNLIYALARLEAQPSTRFQRNYFAWATPKLPEFQASDLAITIGALAKLNIVPPNDFLDAFFRATAEKAGSFTPREFSNTFGAFSKLAIVPPADFLSRIFSSKGIDLEKFSGFDLTILLHAFACLGIAPTQGFLDLYFETLLKKLPDLSDAVAAKTLWSVAVLSVYVPLPERILDFALSLLEGLQSANLSSASITACHHAALRLFPEEVPRFSAGEFSRASSVLEKNFLANLMVSDFFPDEKLSIIDPLGTKTDYAFYINENPVLMEFDGPYHFVKPYGQNTFVYNGSTILMTALIVQTCPQAVLIRVGIQEAEALVFKNPLKHLNLQDLKEKLAHMQPGAYRVKFRRNKVSLEPISYLAAPQRKTPALSLPKRLEGPQPF